MPEMSKGLRVRSLNVQSVLGLPSDDWIPEFSKELGTCKALGPRICHSNPIDVRWFGFLILEFEFMEQSNGSFFCGILLTLININM
jgi:hypothetical protein